MSASRLFASAVAGLTLCVLVGVVLTRLDGHTRRSAADASARLDGVSAETLDFDCEYDGNTFYSKEHCARGHNAHVLVWGDSLAKQLVGGLSYLDIPFVQATKSGCPPVLGRSPYTVRRADFSGGVAWSRQCLEFNESVYQHVASTQGYKIAVLASAFVSYSQWDHYMADGQIRHPDFLDRVAGLEHTMVQLQKLGITVYLAYPPPATGEDPTECLLRKSLGRAANFTTLNEHCDILKSRYETTQADLLSLLDAATRASGAKALDYSKILCDDAVCRTSVDGMVVYRDTRHIRFASSEYLAKRTAFFDSLRTDVRTLHTRDLFESSARSHGDL